MNKQYKGILFDLDGTILDTADDLGAALNHVLTDKGFPTIERARYKPVASDGSTGLLNLGFGDALKQYDLEVLRQQFLDYYEKNIADHTQLYKGMTELFQFLERNHIPWGIVTNKPIELTRKLLPHYSELINSRINLGGDSLPTRKPDPAPLIHACEHLGINPSECIYVGDAPRDIQAGNAANMYSVIALWGYIPENANCADWLANAEIKKPTELITLFE